MKEKELYESLEQSYSQHKDEPRYSAPMNAIIWSNYRKKGELGIMCEALYDLFADELEEHEAKGKAEGVEIGIRIFIEDNMEEKVTESRIIEKLQKKFLLSQEKAEKYVEKYKRQFVN